MFYNTNGLVNGATRQKLTQAAMRQMKIPSRTLQEQDKIVEKIKLVFEAISIKKEELENLELLVKARFVELFGSLNDNEKGLDIVSIEELCTLIKDGTHQTPTYTEDKQNGFKFLSSKDVMTQKICWDDIKYIPAELHEKLYATIRPQRNDILMSKNGVNYGVAAVNDTDEIFDIYVSLALLRPRIDMVNPVYLRCVINNPDTKRQFDSSIKGIGVPNLHLGEIKKTKVLLPPIDKQNEFVAFVEQTEKSKLAVQQSIAELEELKKSFMQKYFG
jgi:type I restriction enzyme S subunit